MSQMEENAHCPSPEKLSSLAFCLSMNSLFAHRGPRLFSRVQRDRAVPGQAVLGWTEAWVSVGTVRKSRGVATNCRRDV